MNGEDFSDLLKSLQSEVRGVRSAFLATSQGRFLASTHISGMEKVQLGGISAASMAIASKAAGDLQLGELGQIHITGDVGSILLLRVGGKAVLTLVVEDRAEIAQILHEAKRAAAQLAYKV
jgi:uncharacterized protein